MGLFSRPARPQHEMLDSVIGPTANLTGSLRSDGGLRIDGHFEGLVEVAGNVVVSEGARVLADISARNITVAGLVKGNISGTGRLEILSTGQVIGDITVASVMIDDGGIFQGVSRMRGYEQRALAAPAASAGNGAGQTVYIEEARTEPVATVDLTARPAASPAEATEPKAAEPRASGPVVEPDDVDDPDDGIRFDDIEPVIPDIVIEEPPPSPPPAAAGQRRRTRR
jgi:cytoskeletal protein CcmA (bactofilin family)